MLKTILLLLLILGAAAASIFYPLYLPQPMVDMIEAVLLNLWAWNGILPISAILQTVYFVVQVIFYWFMFKIIMSAFGGGNEIE